MATSPILGGFNDPVDDAQRCFRGVLDAMARPGKIIRLTSDPPCPAGIDPATMAVCLTLLDAETSLWVDGAETVKRHLVFHTGVEMRNVSTDAAFALVLDANRLTTVERYRWGSDRDPEDGATLIVQVASLANRSGWRLTGPGIEQDSQIEIVGPPEGFFTSRRAMTRSYPRGVDMILCCGPFIACLPRTTEMER